MVSESIALSGCEERDPNLLHSPRDLPDESHFQKRQCSCKKVAGEWICSGRKCVSICLPHGDTERDSNLRDSPEVSLTRLSLPRDNALARSFLMGNGFVEVLSVHAISPTWRRLTRYVVVGDVVEDIKRVSLSTFHQVADGKAHHRL